jgi:uncharacterized protein HemX
MTFFASGSGTLYAMMALTAVSIGASAAGAGMSYYGQQQQAKNAQNVANYNAQIQQQNARIQQQVAQQNAALSMANYQQQQNNAQTIQNQTVAQEAQGREQTARLRQQQQRQLGLVRSQYAASGVVNEGSPLTVLADTARLTELNIQDSAYSTELQRQQTLQRADQERFQSGSSLFDAGMQNLQAAASTRIGYRQADLTKLSGQSQAQGYQLASYGSLISGASQIAGTASDYAWRSKH